MVRPGPKTGQLEDVKTAIVQLLKDNPEGLNFNEIFRRLRKEDPKLLGSFSVLSKAIKDLFEYKIVSYKELEKPKYKIRKRIYTLTPKTQIALKDLQFKPPKPNQHMETTEQVSMDLFKGIKKPSEAALLGALLMHVRELVYVYRQIVEENGDPQGLWRLLLNDVLRGKRKYMETRAEWARSGKGPLKKKQELDHTIKVISKWIQILTIYGISLQAELMEKEKIKSSRI